MSTVAFAVLIAFLLSLIPLWINLGASQFAALRLFHIMGAVLFLLTIAKATYRRSFAAIFIQHWPFFFCFAGFLAITLILAASYEQPYFDARMIFRQVFYMTVAVSFGAVITAEPQAGFRAAVLFAVLAPLALAATVTVSLAATGASAASLLSFAIKNADPDIIIFGLFKSAVVDESGEDVRANLRHALAGLMLTAALLPFAFSGVRSRLATLLTWGGLASGIGLAMISMSRAVMLAVTLVIAVTAIRITTAATTSWPLFLLIFACLLAVTIGVSPVGDLIFSRFFDQTDSYGGRTAALQLALADIQYNPWIGLDGVDRKVSAHNFILDALRGGGIFAGIFALCAYVSLIVTWWRLVTSSPPGRDDRHCVMRASACAAIGVLPLVRLMTAGDGLLHQTEWLALGVMLCAVPCRLTQSRLETSGVATTPMGAGPCSM